MEDIKKLVKSELDKEVVPGLSDFIRIPNLSRDFDNAWNSNGLLQQAAQQIIEWVKRQNLKNLT
jgi:hypothetical protein